MNFAYDETKFKNDRLVFVYAIKLRDGCYYIGKSNDLNRRYLQHCTSKQGALWTCIHKPIEIDVARCDITEKQLTLIYMLRYGYKKVRGSVWCKLNIHKPSELYSLEKLKYAFDKLKKPTNSFHKWITVDEYVKKYLND